MTVGTTPLHERLGPAVRYHRTRLGMSQAAVARVCKKSQPWVANIEAGRDANLSTVELLAACFGMKAEELLAFEPSAAA